MTNEAFGALESRVLADLDEKLDPLLSYHCRKHTEDVVLHTERIAIAENINDPRLLLLMKVAALFHDTGFIDAYAGHEERSCLRLQAAMNMSEFDRAEIDLMSEMIMATKVPQSPQKLQDRILCDADLDYLGRDDFPVISNRLKNELLAVGMITDPAQWNELQIDFLRKHRYFTGSSVALREPVKRNHLLMLMKSFKTDKP